MSNKNIKIPGRLESAAVEGVVAGADAIYDDTKKKSQSEINAQTDEAIGALDTKIDETAERISAEVENVDNKVDALQKQDIVVVDTLPAVADADSKKIYRLTGTDSYTDYMLNSDGSAFKAMAIYSFPGIDDEPTAGSNNLVKSGGVERYINNILSENFEIKVSGKNTGGYFNIDIKSGTTLYFTNKSAYQTPIYFRKEKNNTEQVSLTLPKDATVSYTFESDFKYIYFYNASHSTDYSKIIISSRNITYEGLNKDVEVLSTSLDGLDYSVSELENEMLNGTELSQFMYSNVADNGFGKLKVPCILSQIGDYIEFDVMIGNANTQYSRLSTASGTKPGIYNYNGQKVAVRLPGTSATATSDASSEYAIGKRHIFKIILDSIESNNRTYKMYLDGNQITFNRTLENTSDFTLDSIGDPNQEASGAKWYYLKYKTAGVEHVVTEFQTNLNDVNNITDVYDTSDLDGLAGLNERVSELENEMSTMPKMFYSFNASSGDYTQNSKGFFVYCHISGNIYVRYYIGLYKPGSGSDTSIAKHYWRLEETVFTEYNGSSMSIISGKKLLTNGESEFVIRQTSPTKIDYTGGYHGCEYIYDENGDLISGAFIEFYADNAVVSLSSSIPLTACESFFYKELSPMFETANTGDDQTNVGRLIAWHTKETHFTTEGYTTENRLDMVEQIPFYAYGGIVCIDRSVSAYAMGEKYPLTAMGTGEPTTDNFTTIGASSIYYKGNGFVTTVTSECIFGDDNSMNELRVRNVINYNKYYRKTQTLTNCTKLKCRTEVAIKIITT